MPRLIIDKETCTGCGACLEACPYDALSLENDVAVVNEKCTFCGACVEDVCPVDAITLEKEEQKVAADLGEYRDVWVFIEHEQGKVAGVSFELLGQAAKLAEGLECSV